MQYKFFTIPATGTESSGLAEELNAFLRGHRILSVQRELVRLEHHCYWCCCVEYLEYGGKTPEVFRSGGREKVDYRSVLSESDFEKFRLLRECRKRLAEEDAVPAYAVFLDEHLAAMAQQEELSESSLRKINGVGEKKAEKYGKRFLEAWSIKCNEKNGQSVSENSGT